MSRTPPLQGSATSDLHDDNAAGVGAAGRWGTVSGGLRSPPPAPSSGAGVRRNHTIHGARHHDKPRLEKHFEQPEDPTHILSGQNEHSAVSSSGQRQGLIDSEGLQNSDPASSLGRSTANPLSSPSSRSDTVNDVVGSLTPLQALYSKSTVSRNHSLPSRHSSRHASNLPSSATQGRSSLFNSLSAITGGSDLDEHDWEKLIHSGNALGEDHGDADVQASASMLGESAWSESIFNHRRFPSGPPSAQLPASPVARSDFFNDSLGGRSTAATGTLDVGAFASSPIMGSTGLVRRHQSLNHHSGRDAAERLATRSSHMLLRESMGSGGAGSASSAFSTAQALDPHLSPARQTTSLSAASSPIVPSNYSKAPWNTQNPIGSPSRFGNAAPLGANNYDASHRRFGSGLDAASSPLLDLHSGLSNLEISGSVPLTGGGSGDSGDTATPTATSSEKKALPMRPVLSSHNSASDIHTASTGRKLPSLITSREMLQRGAGGGSSMQGPASAAAFVPPIGHAHARTQSSDPSNNVRTFDEPSKRFGPFTAAPVGPWHDKETIAGAFGGLGRPPPHDAVSMSVWQQQQPGGGVGLDFSNTGGMDPNMLALSMALAHEQQKNALLQAQLGAQAGGSSAGFGSQDARLFGMNPIQLQNGMQSIGQQLRGGGPGGAAAGGAGGNGPALGLTGGSPHFGGGGSLSARAAPFAGSHPGLGITHPTYSSIDATAGNGSLSDSGVESGAVGRVTDTGVTPPTPVDPATLAQQKGYNPPLGTFDLAPIAARFFVIKSYTEDDVHKSLKYEIWASTDKGNQRLDKAFRESAHMGPIYLFFSVNASGHFCGMAQMLTPLDYTTSSNVWAQDGKWKGTFKVRWIYVKDLPNNQLRHIRLTNTPECKPVTQSRDTQELTPEAGREVLRIMAEYISKTSLLQDFNFYEMQSRQPGSGQAAAAGTTAVGNSTGPQQAIGNAVGLESGIGLASPPTFGNQMSPRPVAGSPALGSDSALPHSPSFGLGLTRGNGNASIGGALNGMAGGIGGLSRRNGQGTPQRSQGGLGGSTNGPGFRTSTPPSAPSPGPGAAALSNLYFQSGGPEASPRQQTQDSAPSQSQSQNRQAFAAAQSAGLRPSALG